MQEAFVASLLAIAARGGKSVEEANREAERWSGPQDPMKSALGTLHANFARKLPFGDLSDSTPTSDAELDKLELWIEMKKQVKILREEMDEDNSKTAWGMPSRPKVANPVLNPTQFRDELDAILHGGQERRPRHPISEFEQLYG
jgi:hypothetical protein